MNDNHDGPTPPVTSTQGIARKEAERAVDYHATHCGFTVNECEKRLRNLEGRFMLLTGFMAGSGFIGGATGAAVIKLLGGCGFGVNGCVRLVWLLFRGSVRRRW
jgi:hypothetical protein